MVNMKLEKKDNVEMKDTVLGGSEYPSGLQIYLDDESLKKLGISSPDMKKAYILHCKAEIISFTQRIDDKGEKKTMALQITDMEIAAEEKASTSQTLYGGGLKGNINYVEGF